MPNELAPNILGMSFSHCLRCTKISVQVRGTCSCSVNTSVFMVRSWHHLAQPPRWWTAPCKLSATAYWIYSQLLSILEAVPPSETWGCALLWCQGRTYHGLNGLPFKNFTLCPHRIFNYVFCIEQTAIISPHSNKSLVFTTLRDSVQRYYSNVELSSRPD